MWNNAIRVIVWHMKHSQYQFKTAGYEWIQIRLKGLDFQDNYFIYVVTFYVALPKHVIGLLVIVYMLTILVTGSCIHLLGVASLRYSLRLRICSVI